MKIRFIIILHILSLSFISCKNESKKFEKKGWNERIDGFWINREKMINDVTENHLKKGMDYKDLVELLGKPYIQPKIDESDSITMSYEIMVDYKWNIDPMEGKDLFIFLSKDSIITSFEVKYWEK